MKFFESIKNYFKSEKNEIFCNSEEDAKILSAIGRESIYLKASNGRYYYYYFPQSEASVDIAKYLLNRNGVMVKKHKSRYYYPHYASLRISRNKLDKNVIAKKFVGSIHIDISNINSSEIDNLLKKVYGQRKVKVK